MPTLIRNILVTFSMLVTSALTMTAVFGNTASAVVDNTPDCDNVAIIRCGAFDADTLRQKASQNDVPKIFDHMGISQNDLKGQFVNGIVWRDGRVTVDGKVVATDAMTAGRNYGGTPIAGTNAGVYSTSKFVTEGQTAFVKLKADGTFDYAVIKACGNPVKATPKTVPVKEQPEETFQVCDISTGNIITIKQSEFNESMHSRDLTLCKKQPIQVCDLFTKEVKTIDEKDFNEVRYSRDLSKCEKQAAVVKNIQVCDLNSKTFVAIKESEYDSTRHSRDNSDCEEAPQVIAATGPASVITGITGSSALGYGAYAYANSRRALRSIYKK